MIGAPPGIVVLLEALPLRRGARPDARVVRILGRTRSATAPRWRRTRQTRIGVCEDCGGAPMLDRDYCAACACRRARDAARAQLRKETKVT